MHKTGKLALFAGAFVFAAIPLLSQTTPAKKPSFEVVSIKPSAPNLGIRGGGPRGDRYTMTGANLRMLLQQGYQRMSNNAPIGGALQIIGGPAWIDSDRYDIQATADCSGGVLSRQQVQWMIQSMLEDRFQLKAHTETRDLPIYNLIPGKDGPKLKASEDQTPPALGGPAGPPQPCSPATNAPPPLPLPPPGQRGGPGDPNFVLPRGAMMIMMNPTGLTLQATGVPLGNLINMLQNQVGRPIIDKTDLKGLFDFKLQFSPEGLNLPNGGTPFGPLGPGPGGAGGAGPATTAASDPVPSLFTAIQELGLRLESSKGPVEVLVVDSVQKPTEN